MSITLKVWIAGLLVLLTSIVVGIINIHTHATFSRFLVFYALALTGLVLIIVGASLGLRTVPDTKKGTVTNVKENSN